MFKIPTATFITLSGLVAAGLLLIALTGENVSSSMDVMSIITLPGIPTTIPSVPAVPTISVNTGSKPTATPAPQATPVPTADPARAAPPRNIPESIRVTALPSPTPEPTPVSTSDGIIEEPTSVPTATTDMMPVSSEVPKAVERSSPSSWLVLGLIAVVGTIFVVFGVYSAIRRGK